MAFKTDDRIFETSVTAGAGDYTLDGAQVGFATFAGLGAGNTGPYFATDDINWEVGIGTVLAAPARLARTKILRSSNADAAVVWGAGTRKIRCGQPAAMGLPTPECRGRLTLASATPVTTVDQLAKAMLYFTPYNGATLGLYVGSAGWINRALPEVSIAVPAVANQVYDVFAYDNAGVPALELLAWTNDTTLATTRVLQDGVLCKTGDTSRRYLGTFRTTAVAGQTEDSYAKRFVWNYYNRVLRPMKVVEATDSWTYTTATLRQMNNSTANQLDIVIGASEDLVRADVRMNVSNSSAFNAACGIGLDRTNGQDATKTQQPTLAGGGFVGILGADYIGFPGIGRHFLAALEHSQATGTTTWYGDNGSPATMQSGITGEVMG